MLAFAVAATWLAVLLLAMLLGLPLGRSVVKGAPSTLRVSMWLGLGLLTALVLALSLLGPLKSLLSGLVFVLVPILVGGITLWCRGVLWLRHGWLGATPKVVVVLLLGSLAILSIGATLAPTHYDFSLYHYSGLSWAAQYGTVPGLANLIDYLGYSNSATPWSAALTNGYLGDRGYAAFAGLWVAAVVADALLRLSSSDTRKRPGSYVSATNVLVLLAPALFFADIYVASPTSDTAVFALILASGAGLVDGVASRRWRADSLVSTVAPLLIASSMRPQILLIVGVSSALFLFLTWRDRSTQRPVDLALPALLVSALGFALAIFSVLRDYRLSGWAVYPLSVLAFDVPWRAEDPTVLRAITIGIARDSGPAYQDAAHGYAWLIPWFRGQFQNWETWTFLLLLVSAGALAVLARSRGNQLRIRRLIVATVPFTVFAATWVFLLPPTWRHSWGAVFGLNSILLGWTAWRAGIAIRVWAIVLSLLAFAVALVALFVRFPAKPTALEQRELNPVVTESGLTLLQPSIGDDRCGIAPLLCTPMPRDDLALRGDGLRDGFLVQ